MNYSKITSFSKVNIAIGIIVFLISFLTYLTTMQPTLPFWDSGEYAAVAYTMGVPHPPGAPIFTMLGRVFTLLPFFESPAASVNFLSVVSSSIAIMLCYFCLIRIIQIYRASKPELWSVADQAITFFSATIGALSLAFSYTFWFSAVETEAYAPSILLYVFSVWCILKWYEKADEKGSDKWLLLIALTMGVMLGVHLQALLSFFGIAMFYYARKNTFTWKGFIYFAIMSAGLFLIIYPGIVIYTIVLIEKTSIIMASIIPLGLLYWIYYSHKHQQKKSHFLATSLFLIILGYSSIVVIYFRAQVKPPINENNPSTVEKMFSYLSREQYGNTPIVNRRWSSDPVNKQNYTKYSSDLDYFWTYQIKHMYLRYLGWNFVGKEGDIQDDGIEFKDFWALPLLLGIFGCYYGFRKNIQIGIAIFALFFISGVALVVQLNMPEPQPRERDYIFVSSFFAFALWIGLGIEGLFSRIKKIFNKKPIPTPLVFAIGIVALLLINARMFQVNLPRSSRAGNYVPFDYAYNLLQSCEKDAIIFTNGDNDTFPLWYLQEGEGIRQDIRVINLSLANTTWHVKQLIHETPRGAKKVRMNLTDKEIDRFTYSSWSTRTITLPLKDYPLLEMEKQKYLSGERQSSIYAKHDIPAALPDTLTWKFEPTERFQGRGYIRLQDRVVYETLVNNLQDRPIYFSATVSEKNFIGISSHLRTEGYAYRVSPLRSDLGIDSEPNIHYQKVMRVFKYRNFDNPDVYYDEVARRMVGNYRSIFLNMSHMLSRRPDDTTMIQNENGTFEPRKNKELAIELVDFIFKKVPDEIWQAFFYPTSLAIETFSNCDEIERAKELIPELEKQVYSYSQTVSNNIPATYHLARAYKNVKMYDKAIGLMESIQKKYPDDKSISNELMKLQAQALTDTNKNK